MSILIRRWLVLNIFSFLGDSTRLEDAWRGGTSREYGNDSESDGKNQSEFKATGVVWT